MLVLSFDKRVFKTANSCCFASIVFGRAMASIFGFLAMYFMYFFRLYVNAAIITCLLACLMPLVFTRFKFKKFNIVPNTGSTVLPPLPVRSLK